MRSGYCISVCFTDRQPSSAPNNQNTPTKLISFKIESSQNSVFPGLFIFDLPTREIAKEGMLQHSRGSSGIKELTSINALADEYLRLSYHGLRAKDKTFNAEIKTDFDNTIGKIDIVPQDVGRVLLNLYNNAFYAVAEKKRQQPEGYEPTISVSTTKEMDKIVIRVKDNGNGIAQKVVDKIFQPFFTTKPTGQGTGLGLSLSYDIVKANEGEIKVNTKEGEFTEFVVVL